jgi:hypothetical protein
MILDLLDAFEAWSARTLASLFRLDLGLAILLGLAAATVSGRLLRRASLDELPCFY